MILSSFAHNILPPEMEWKQKTVTTPKIEKYEILTTGTIQSLTKLVQDYIDQGWEPYGIPVAAPHPHAYNGIRYLQTVVKYQTHKEEHE